MTEQDEAACLGAVVRGTVMGTNIFALRKAEAKGLVQSTPHGPGVKWTITDAGRKALNL